MVLTVIPSDATSEDSVFKAAVTDARKALDKTMPANGCFTTTDSSATMRPHFRARMPGRTAWTSRSALCSESVGGVPIGRRRLGEGSRFRSASVDDQQLRGAHLPLDRCG